MITYNNLYSQIYAFENLYLAYIEAAQNKRYHSDILLFSANLEENLITLQNELIWKTYQPQPFTEFLVYDPKKRFILAPAFRDRVIQCAVHRIVAPIYWRTFIDDSYACLPGKGPQKAALRVQHCLRVARDSPYDWAVGQMDVLKFFFRIPYDVQLRELARPIRDKKLLWLYETMLVGTGLAYGLPEDVGSNIEDAERIYGLGMPTGCLLSQLTGNVCLSRIDNVMKREEGVRYLVRYMDDTFMADDSMDKIKHYVAAYEYHLETKLQLKLNKKTKIQPANLKVQYVGYQITPEQIRLRKSTALRIRRSLKKYQELYNSGKITLEELRPALFSYMGMLDFGNCQNLKKEILDNFVLCQDTI